MTSGRPVAVDLFCKAGGATKGYQRAGYYVVGVDIEPQPRYCGDEFVQADAMTFPLKRFDLVHAGPPCQAYSTATADRSKHPDLYGPVRDRLVANGRPWVIENVIGAPYAWGVQLCGTMFGLETVDEWLRRHRNFESSHLMFQMPHRHRKDQRAVTITSKSYLTVTKDVARLARQPTFALAQELMGIDWMTRYELSQAIPPAYTEWIGRQLLEQIGKESRPNG